jgi:peptidoglycan/xylan/chitin deacetylase (PgdA/CDA1 family)
MLPAIKSGAIRVGLETLYYSGAHRLARPLMAGVGAILTFHRVRPPRREPFQPNRHLEISPAFLGEVVQGLRARGVDIVSIGEAQRRLVERDFARRFALLTFDDGYRDNLVYAWPILKRQRAPFTVYVASAFADGEGMLWWLTLEASIARSATVTVRIDGARRVFDCATLAAKMATWQALYDHFTHERDEARMRSGVRAIAKASGVDPTELCREACMSWDDLAGLARSDLVTIGAHTRRHPVLSRLDDEEARIDIDSGARRIEGKLGIRPRHFAYPVGNAGAAGGREFRLAQEAGFETAVTTRPGVLFGRHAGALMALPRMSVNGDYQRTRYVDVLLSGAATALWNGFRRGNAA